MKRNRKTSRRQAQNDRRFKALILIGIPVITFVVLLIKYGYGNAIIGFVIAIAIIVIVLWLIKLGIIRIIRQWKYGPRRRGNYTVRSDDQLKIRRPIPTSIRQQVFARAHGRCERPNCSYSGKLEIHHIDGNPSNNDPHNLLALCPSCHTRIGDGAFSVDAQRSWIAL